MLLIFSFQFNTKINFTIKLSFQLKLEKTILVRNHQNHLKSRNPLFFDDFRIIMCNIRKQIFHIVCSKFYEHRIKNVRFILDLIPFLVSIENINIFFSYLTNNKSINYTFYCSNK